MCIGGGSTILLIQTIKYEHQHPNEVRKFFIFVNRYSCKWEYRLVRYYNPQSLFMFGPLAKVEFDANVITKIGIMSIKIEVININ